MTLLRPLQERPLVCAVWWGTKHRYAWVSLWRDLRSPPEPRARCSVPTDIVNGAHSGGWLSVSTIGGKMMSTLGKVTLRLMRMSLAWVVLVLNTPTSQAANIDYSDKYGVTIEGTIEYNDETKFASVVTGVGSQTLTIGLTSPGGVIGPAIAIGRLIHERGYATSVFPGGECASACGLIWLAGSSKFVGTNAHVGFHAAYNASTLQESGKANALIGKYLGELGYSDGAVEYATHAAPDQMQWLTREDAIAFNIKVENLNHLPVRRSMLTQTFEHTNSYGV
jgi:hypothetical protein